MLPGRLGLMALDGTVPDCRLLLKQTRCHASLLTDKSLFLIGLFLPTQWGPISLQAGGPPCTPEGYNPNDLITSPGPLGVNQGPQGLNL